MPAHAPTSQKCYNLSVSSLRARLHIKWLLRGSDAGARFPPVFVLGVLMMVVVVGGLTLRSVVARGGDSAVPAGASPVGASPVATATPAIPGPFEGASASVRGSAPASPTAGPSPYLNLTGYVWPLDDAMITLPFGPTSWGEVFVNGERFHDGLDMATACGDNVHAAHDGTVLAASRQYDEFVGWVGDLTPYHHLLDTKHWWNSLPIVIVIDDGDGYRSIYAHESQVTVKPGQKVTAGQVIGYEGATGNATGCHVHFGLFSPTETATFETDPAVVAADLVPRYEIARIDPLLVLPFRCEVEEMRALRPVEAEPCPPLPSASPSAGSPAKTTPTHAPTAAPTATPTAKASVTPSPKVSASH